MLDYLVTDWIVRLPHTIIGPFDTKAQADSYLHKIDNHRGKVQRMFLPAKQWVPAADLDLVSSR